MRWVKRMFEVGRGFGLRVTLALIVPTHAPGVGV